MTTEPAVPRPPRRHRWLLVVAILATTAATACVGPARTDDSYRGKAASTLDQVRSAVETAEVGASASGRHGLPSSYVSVLLAEAEEDASAAQATFDSIQPPSGRTDRTRTAVHDLVGDAVDELATLRIEARRGDLSRLPSHVDDLQQLARQLDDLATDLQDRP